MDVDQLPLPFRMMAAFHRFPFGAQAMRGSPPLVQQAYHWLEQQRYIEQESYVTDGHGEWMRTDYALTEWGKSVAWQMAAGRYCGSCYWWSDGQCTMPPSPSTVNCGEQPWHAVCEQHVFREEDRDEPR